MQNAAVMTEELEPRLFFTITCRRCRRTLRFIATSKDDLLERIAATQWEMQPSASMADPVDDCEDFLCPNCVG
jgi:hypothetical protein